MKIGNELELDSVIKKYLITPVMDVMDEIRLFERRFYRHNPLAGYVVLVRYLSQGTSIFLMKGIFLRTQIATANRGIAKACILW